MAYQIKRLDVDSLDSETRAAYALYLEPSLRSCLSGIDPYELEEARIVVIGVFYQNQSQPIGLSVARIVPSSGTGEILSFFINKEHSHRKLGTRLFQQMEEECIAEKCKVLLFRYQRQAQTTPFLEEILKKAAWHPPKLFMIRCFLDSYTFHPPWFSKPPPLPPHCQEFLWIHLSKEEKNKLLHRYEQGRYETSIFPFCGSDQDKIEPINSLGLRNKEQVIGWMITHRISHDTLRYSSLYIEPKYRNRGSPIRLLIDSITLQQQSPVRWALFEINIHEVDPSWTRFVKYRLIPYALVVREIYQTWKTVKDR